MVIKRAPLLIGIAQPTITSDPRRNGAVIRDALRFAADHGARLVQFPEGMLSGYAKEQLRSWDDVDWPAVEEELALVAELAARLGVWAVVGSAHRLESHRPFNSLYVVSDAGQVVRRYDKRLCSFTEIERFYSPGFEPTVFEVGGYRFGCALCVEVHYPEIFAEYERLGVDCVLLSAYPIAAVFETEARAHAATNCYWVALSTPAQTSSLFTSSLVAPDGARVAPVAAGDGVEVFALDPADEALRVALVHARPWRATARAGAVYGTRRVVDDPRAAKP